MAYDQDQSPMILTADGSAVTRETLLSPGQKRCQPTRFTSYQIA